LPADVGAAIAAYLQRGRPASDRREVFLRARAPYAAIASGTVASTVRRACRRAGLPEISARDACSYIAARHPERPWLAAARDCPPEVQRVFAALDQDGPFATLIAVATTCCSPDSDVDDYDRLKRRAKREDNEEMRVFKSELRQALADPRLLPDDELFESVEYDDGSDEAFLRRLWRDLYGDEPVDGP